METGTANFPERGAAARSPLAERLFELPEVTGVFFGTDFITVTKNGDSEWHQLKPAVLAAIMEHFTAGRPVVIDGPAAAASAEVEEENEIVSQIKELLETRVRPAVAQDGGDIVYRGYKEGKLYLGMQGACSGCPSSTVTLKRGVESLIKHYVPEVETIEAI